MPDVTLAVIGITGTLLGIVLGAVIGLGVLQRRLSTPRCPYCHGPMKRQHHGR